MLLEKTINELAEGLRKKQFSCVDLVMECYENIEKYNKKINAFITIVDKEIALKNAREIDKTISNATSRLHGIPFVLKDAYVTKNIRTTSASFVLKEYIPQYSATVYQKLLDAGAILIGKMNMDAWGHGGSSENTDFGPVSNPYDLKRSAGGSSGGNAAAIASRMCVFAIGEDTGGSIRNPACWCNISGLKVTYGRVSRYGTIAYASSFDSVGPMAKSVEDLAIILETIAGKDKNDATSSPNAVPKYTQELKNSLKGTVIGIPREYFGKGLDKDVNDEILNAIDTMKQLGVGFKDISIPLFDYGLPVYYLIGPSETSSNLARYDGIRYGEERKFFSEETTRRIMIGTYALSSGYYDAYYKQAQKVRTLFIEEYKKALSQCDAIIMPVMPTPAVKLGSLLSDPLQNLLADIYTVSQNPVGVPSLAIPCGFTKEKLPVGMQIVGNMFAENLLLRLGYHYQKNTSWHKQRPDLIIGN